MSLKDCVRLVKTLDPTDRDSFNAEFETLTKGGVPAEEAYVEAAEAVMEQILADRNNLAAEVAEKGGYLEVLTLENLVNPASYSAAPRGAASEIADLTADEFDALLEESAPAPAKDQPAPKDEFALQEPVEEGMTDADVAAWISKNHTGKRLNRASVKDLKKIAKAAGIPGYSKMDKATVGKALTSWHEQRKVDQLPDPIQRVMIEVGEYNSADSSMRTLVKWWKLDGGKKLSPDKQQELDRNVRAIAKHFGGSAPKTATMYEGGKTEKGIHFRHWDDMVRFFQYYKGETPVRENTMRGGETQLPRYHKEYEPKEGEFYQGDAVRTIDSELAGLGEGEVIQVQIDEYDDAPVYLVRFEDPETGEEYTEYFTQQELRAPEPEPPPNKAAKDALKAAAKAGVEGADEALTGLAKLFGGKGKFSSGFSFDEDTYAQAKPHFKQSLEKFVAAGKSLKEFIQFIVENFGEGAKQYLKRFHQDIVDGNIIVKGVNDVQPTAPAQAPAGEPRAEPADQVDTADVGADAAEVPRQATERPAEEEGTTTSRIGLPVDSTVDVGEQSDIAVLGDSGEFQPARGVTGHQDGRRGNVAGAEGVSASTPGDQQVETAALKTSERLNLRPTTDVWIPSDPGNVAESAPALFPEQVDDVVFAERRLFDNGQRGVMFTNGTGTGKTLTGLGIIKRMVMQGKDNILIVVPGEKVARDWMKTGNTPAFSLGITKLKDTKDAGQGVVVTTYANLSDNNEIVKRDWDLVVHDEAHKLSENMAGNATNALNKSRAITGHPDGRWVYATAMEAELLDKIEGLKSQAKHFMDEAATNPESRDSFIKAAAAADTEREELYQLWRERLQQHTQNRKELWEANTTKRLDLTATPFAYEKSVDHAEGFLFDYDRSLDEQSRGYNQPDSRGAFMVEHFGYRMRTGKLTEPEADVDRSLMQREFNEWLKSTGALRGRVLTVDHDYSREFIAIDDLVGKKIDDGWDLIRARSMDKNNPNAKGYELMDKALRKQFNYHARVRMLEAIKARFAVQRAKQHIAMGRKVVLFHSRIQGGTRNPFHIFAGAAAAAEMDIATTDEEAALYQAAASEFVNERNDLMTLDINTVRPLDLFAEEFGDQLTTYNGTITNKQKRENPDRFNSDGEQIQVIAVQDEGGKEGISLHDATGANQRVLINLGLPVRPTQAIQIEGRIYRVGQMSDAIFEYFNTGTNFERMTFAEKISERASTAENLAMGEQARTLKDSFIDAFEDPSFEDPSEAQGKGGKEIDRANWAATTEFERAKTHYFGQLKKPKQRQLAEGIDYFATPEPLGVKMVEWSGVKPNESILEPSAGHGAIARYFPDNVSATFIEPSSELLSRLALRAPGNHRQMQFEDLDVGGNKFSAIVMNPPFGSGGSTAIAHLHKAMHHLKNGGRIVALIPEGPAADKKFDNMFYGKEGELEAVRERLKKKRREGGSVADETRRIDDLTNFHLRASISLPPITFTRANTAVRSRIVVIDKIENRDAAIVNQPPRELFADTIKDFFDQIEHMGVPERSARSEDPRDYLANEGLVVSEDAANGIWRIKGKTYEHRKLIARALGDDVEFSKGAGHWISKVDPVDALYREMTAPEPAAEPAAQPDIAAAAAALLSGQVPAAGERFTTAETTHAKKGIDLFVASFKERVSKEEYSRVLQVAKKHGGYYSAYKARGAIPGFQFESAEDRAAFIEEIEKPLAMRAPRQGGSTTRQVREWLKRPLKRISSRIPVKIVQRTDQIPTGELLAEDGRGWLVDGTVYLVADNIGSQQDAEITFAHEAVGHLGVMGALGRRKVNELIGDISNMKIENMFSPGTHPELAEILDTIRSTYVDENGEYTLDPREEALEIIAHIAQKRPRIGALAELYNKVVLWLKQFMSQLGFTVDVDMLQIEEALVKAAAFIRDPPKSYTGQIPIDQRPLASRPPAEEGEPSKAEQEAIRKLGLEGKKTLWQKINNLRLKVIVETMDSMAARGYEGLFDGLIEIKRKEMESGTGIGIGDYENSAYVSARLATGVADMMTHIMHYGPLQWQAGVAAGIENTRGLLDVMGDLGTKNLNDWLLWMGANRAKQLMAEGRERNLTEEQIAAGIAKAGPEGSEKHQLFTRVKNEYAFMNRMMLDFAEQAGLIDPVKRAEWESDWYVPFYRMSEDEIEAPRLKRGLSHQESGIRRLFGAEIPTANLLENIITNWLKLTDASVKNHALRLMIDNFEGKADIEGQDYITHETSRFTKALVPRSEIRKRVVQDRAFAKQVAEFMGMDETATNLEVIYELNQVPAAGFEQLWALTAPKDKDIVRLKRNGKNEYWRVHVPGLLRAVGHISEQGSNDMGMRAGRWFKRLLTTGVTLSPDFMLRNFIRDAAHAWAINPDNMWFGIDAIRGLNMAMTKHHPLYMAAMAAGASFQGGYVHGTDPEAGAQMIRRELEKRGLTDDAIHAHFGSIINTPAKLKSAVLRSWQGYREVGDRIENANRIATLDRALKAGKPMAQALFESKDLMDYSRRGNHGLLIMMTDLLPFLNARMQGVDKLGRAVKQHPKMVAKKAAYIAAFSVVLAMWNDDDERYKELPDWEKDAYWHIFPFNNEHIRIPKPFEIGIFAGTLPERAYRAWYTKSQPSEKLLWSLRHNMMETLNINYGIPQFVLPVAEVAYNRSFYFDQPIESISDERLTPRERYNSFTSNTAMEVGDTALAEWLGLSPKQLQHLWNGYTGTMGAYALKVGDMLVRSASDEHPSREAIMPHDWPILRSVYQGQRVKGTQWATDFYDRMQEVRQLHGDMQKYRAEGKAEKARLYRQEHAEKLKLRKRMERVQSRFSLLRKRQDRILLDASLTPVEKYQKRQQIQIQINQLAKKIEGETREAFTQ